MSNTPGLQQAQTIWYLIQLGVANPNGISEYKNLYSARDMTLVEVASKMKDSCLKKSENGKLALQLPIFIIFKFKLQRFAPNAPSLILFYRLQGRTRRQDLMEQKV